MSANSLFEAVAQALRISRDNDWIEGVGRGQTAISVKVKHPRRSASRVAGISAYPFSISYGRSKDELLTLAELNRADPERPPGW